MADEDDISVAAAAPSSISLVSPPLVPPPLSLSKSPGRSSPRPPPPPQDTHPLAPACAHSDLVVEVACSEEIHPLIPSASSASRDDLANPSTTRALAKKRRIRTLESEPLLLLEVVEWVWSGSRYSGIMCAALSSLAYSFMALLVDFLEVQSLPSFEVIFLRCGFIAAAGAVGMRRTRQSLLGSSNVRHVLVARAITGYLSLLGFFYSIQLLRVQDAIMLNFTSPFFTALFARILLKEKLGVIAIGGSFCSFLGLVLAMQPYPFFGDLDSGSQNISSGPYEQGNNNHFYAAVIALVSAVARGMTNCLVRTAAKATEKPLLTVFAFAAISWPLAGLCMVIFQKFVIPSLADFFAISVISLTAMMAQLLLARALQLEKAGKVTCIQYLEVGCLFLLEVLFWGKALSPLSLCGVIIIIFSVTVVACTGLEKS